MTVEERKVQYARPGRKKLGEKKKKVRSFAINPEFYKELQKLNKDLKKIQGLKTKFKIFVSLIPRPYSVMDELEFRYKEFDRMRQIMIEVIMKLPEKEQIYYLNRIPTSPITSSLIELDRLEENGYTE